MFREERKRKQKVARESAYWKNRVEEAVALSCFEKLASPSLTSTSAAKR